MTDYLYTGLTDFEIINTISVLAVFTSRVHYLFSNTCLFYTEIHF